MARERLAERRRELGLSQEDVAQALGIEVGTYSRYERGLMTPRPALHRRLAEILQWEPAQLTLALNDTPPPINGHAVPDWLGVLASLEQAAGQLCAFEATTVHGLLQTADYAFAVERADAVPKSDDGIVRRVETRLARQAVLDRAPEPLELTVILDESILHRVAGVQGVMARQLDHLAAEADRGNVELRVLPFDAGVFAFGSFTLLTTPGLSEPFMAITEDRAGPHYLDRSHDVEAHQVLWAHLLGVALSPAESVDLIRAVSKETPT